MSYELLQRDPLKFWIIFAISLVITIIVYGSFPFVFAKKRSLVITKKKYQFLCYGINAVPLIVFTVLNEGVLSVGPYLLWTSIFAAYGIKVLGKRGIMPDSKYYVMPNDKIAECQRCGFQSPMLFVQCPQCGNTKVKHIHFEDEQMREQPSPDVEADTPSVPEKKSKKQFCRYCGNSIDAETRKCTGCGKQYFKGIKAKARTFLVLALICIVALSSVCVYLYDKTESMQKEIDKQKETINSLTIVNDYKQSSIEELREDATNAWDAYAELAELASDHVAFVGDDGTRVYHQYRCFKFYSSGFYVYTIATAQSLGYEECPYCH